VGGGGAGRLGVERVRCATAECCPMRAAGSISMFDFLLPAVSLIHASNG
jgi:hypothetical protein